MAETITTPGLITSFDNTPQANADAYSYTEAQLEADTDGIIWLDVMSNDLGGKAKTLYSITAGSDTDGDGDIDTSDLSSLLTKDVTCVEELSALGAKISIRVDPADGKVKIAYDPGTLFDSLDDGETKTDTFRYAIRLANGALSWDVVTFTVTGVNDAPTAVDDKRTVNEDETLNAASVLGNDTDPDVEDLDVAAVKVGLATIADGGAGDLDGAADGSIKFTTEAGGTVTLDTETGTFSYEQNGVFNGLDTGETGADSFQYQATDGTATSGFATVDITVNGVTDNAQPMTANDRWVLSNLSSPLSIPALWFLNNDTDVDGDSLVITHINGLTPAGGTGSIVVGDFTAVFTGGVLTSFTYDGSPTGTLASFTYTVSDGNGGSSTSTVNVDYLTTSNNGSTGDNIDLGTLFAANGYDFSWINAQNGPDTVLGESTNINGTAGSDTFLGGNQSDTLEGRAGDDFLDGQGQADTLLGGVGNDTLVWDASDNLVDGGTGTDTLRVSGNLDLTGVADAQISNIDRIDITNYGADLINETLTLNATDVLDHLESDGAALFVFGDAGDTVDLAGAAWSAGVSGIAGFNLWTNAGASVYVDTDIITNVTP
jgi:hypothetical protein